MPQNEPHKHRSGWQRRKRQRPDEILAAARAVARRKGYAAVRMEDIARAAGITKGTIYLYFENKYELLHIIKAESAQTAGTIGNGSLQGFLDSPRNAPNGWSCSNPQRKPLRAIHVPGRDHGTDSV
jgi:hypothetical protein